MTQIDVHGILRACALEHLKPCCDGWRATSPFKHDEGDKGDLWVSKDGGFLCHATQNKGHVVSLYAHCSGKTLSVSRRDLKALGLLPRNFFDGEVRVSHLVPVTADSESDTIKAKRLADLQLLKVEDVDWTVIAKERGVSVENVVKAAVEYRFGFINNYEHANDRGEKIKLGSAYAFLSYDPPNCDNPHLRGAMLRVMSGKPAKWLTAGKYPIWMPMYVKDATAVFLTEGQWDALALCDHLDDLPIRFQPLALCGGKNIDNYPEIFDYFRDKDIYILPDNDSAGLKILTDTVDSIESHVRGVKVLRVPQNIIGKDFNDWVRVADVTPEVFKQWYGTAEPVSVISNGKSKVLIDEAFRVKHNITQGEVFILDNNEKPISVWDERVSDSHVWSNEEVFNLFKPYPLIHEYMVAASECVCSPLLFHPLVFMTYFSAAVGRRLQWLTGGMGRLYPHLFLLLVAPSGIGKNEAINLLKRVIAEVAPKSEDNRDNFIGADQFSYESFFDAMERNPHRILLLYEFSQWLASRSNGPEQKALMALLDMYDSHQYSKESPKVGDYRKKSFCVPEPSLGILAAAVPDQICNVPKELFLGGLVGRFLFVHGTENYQRISQPTSLPEDVADQYRKIFKGVFLTPIRGMCGVRFSDYASMLFDMYDERMSDRMSKIAYIGNQVTYLSRWKVQVQKFALILELCSGRYSFPLQNSNIIVSANSLNAAVKLADLLYRNFKRIFSKNIIEHSDTPTSRLQNRIVRYVKEHSCSEGIKKCDIYAAIRERGDILDVNLNTLVEAGVLVAKQTQAVRGRPSMHYYLPKPKVDPKMEDEIWDTDKK